MDEDGICEDLDLCPNLANSNQNDADGDGVGDDCDFYNGPGATPPASTS